MNHRHPKARIDDREVEAHFIEALMIQLRQRAGRAIERLPARMAPPDWTRHAQLAALRRREVIPSKIEWTIGERLVALEDRASGGRLQGIEQRGLVLREMRVGIDNRMIQTRANFGRS